MQNLSKCFFALLFVSLVGCGGARSTPESTFEAMKEAARNQDTKSMVAVLTPDSVDFMIKTQMSYCFEGYVREVHPDELPEHKKRETPDTARTVDVFVAAKKHGVDLEILKRITEDGDGTPLKEIYAEAADSITDKFGFLARTMEIGHEFEVSSGREGRVYSVWEDATISDIKEDGGAATGTVKMKGRESEFHFRKIDNQWRVHYPESDR